MIMRTPATSGRRSPCTDSVYLLFTIVETTIYRGPDNACAPVQCDRWVRRGDGIRKFFFFTKTCNIHVIYHAESRLPPPQPPSLARSAVGSCLISPSRRNIRFESYVFIINYTSTVRKYKINVQNVF